MDRQRHVVCPYHGWRYDGSAKCVLVPAAPDQPPPLKARAFPHLAEERYGMVWASLGSQTSGSNLPRMGRRQFPQIPTPTLFLQANDSFCLRTSSMQRIFRLFTAV